MAEPDITDWPKRAQVADRLGVTVTSIARFQRDGDLNPLKDEAGAFRFDPAEIICLEAKRGGKKYVRDSLRKEEMQEWEGEAVKTIVGLINEPRKRIDEIQFDIIKDLRAENLKLRETIEKQWAEVEVARDNTAERTAALTMVHSEARIKELAMTRIIEKAGQFFLGGKGGATGVQLTPDQLQQLILAGEFLTPEQELTAKAIVTRNLEESKRKAPATKAETPAKEQAAE